MNNNYDKIAKQYDSLSKLVFGRVLIHAQTCMLHLVPARSHILIAGGGTGWILEELRKIHPEGLQITYVEISANMIAQAQKRNYGLNEVVFINQPIEDYNSPKHFDIIFTAFLFDNFTFEKTTLVFKRLDNMLVNKGKWLFADFHMNQKTTKTWQCILMKSMLLFFRVVSNIEARKLSDPTPLFEQHHYRQLFLTSHYKGFIQSIVYEKP